MVLGEQVIVHQYDHTLATETLLYCLAPWLGRVCDKYVFPVHGAAVAALGNAIFHRFQNKVAIVPALYLSHLNGKNVLQHNMRRPLAGHLPRTSSDSRCTAAQGLLCCDCHMWLGALPLAETYDAALHDWRLLSRSLGLPPWTLSAASPCLLSRTTACG